KRAVKWIPSRGQYQRSPPCSCAEKGGSGIWALVGASGPKRRSSVSWTCRDKGMSPGSQYSSVEPFGPCLWLSGAPHLGQKNLPTTWSTGCGILPPPISTPHSSRLGSRSPDSDLAGSRTRPRLLERCRVTAALHKLLMQLCAQCGQTRAVELRDGDSLPAPTRADQRSITQLEASLLVEEMGNDLGPAPLLLDRALRQVGRADVFVVRGWTAQIGHTRLEVVQEAGHRRWVG